MSPAGLKCSLAYFATTTLSSRRLAQHDDFFARRLGLESPILQAPMAGCQDHRLCAAVCEAGGLGALPGAMLGPSQLRAELDALTRALASLSSPAAAPATARSSQQRPYNVNFFCHEVPPPPSAAALAAWHGALAPYYDELGLDPAAMDTAAAGM
jgi:nitronate monooxygenase